jgi:hypothetical protein
MSITYNEQHQARERFVNRLRWSYGWSPSKKKAFIVDAKGFTVIGPVLSAQTATELCRQHNSTVNQAVL